MKKVKSKQMVPIRMNS